MARLCCVTRALVATEIPKEQVRGLWRDREHLEMLLVASEAARHGTASILRLPQPCTSTAVDLAERGERQGKNRMWVREAMACGQASLPRLPASSWAGRSGHKNGSSWCQACPRVRPSPAAPLGFVPLFSMLWCGFCLLVCF